MLFPIERGTSVYVLPQYSDLFSDASILRKDLHVSARHKLLPPPPPLSGKQLIMSQGQRMDQLIPCFLFLFFNQLMSQLLWFFLYSSLASDIRVPLCLAINGPHCMGHRVLGPCCLRTLCVAERRTASSTVVAPLAAAHISMMRQLPVQKVCLFTLCLTFSTYSTVIVLPVDGKHLYTAPSCHQKESTNEVLNIA